MPTDASRKRAVVSASAHTPLDAHAQGRIGQVACQIPVDAIYGKKREKKKKRKKKSIDEELRVRGRAGLWFRVQDGTGWD